MRHFDDHESKAASEFAGVAVCSARAEQDDSGIGHQRGPHELVGAGLFVVAIHEDQLRPNAKQRHARPLPFTRKMRGEIGQLHGRPEESGCEMIGGEDQDGVTTHVTNKTRSCIASFDR